jgi:hypothetical protein
MADENGSEKAEDLADHESRLSRYTQHLETDDIIHLLLRGHIHLEFALNNIIEAALKHPKELNVERQNFAMKVKLAAAMGLIRPKMKKPLNLLNDLRNQLAHNLDAELNDSVLENFSKQVADSMGMKHTLLIELMLLFGSEGRGPEGLKIEDGKLVFGPGNEIRDFTPQHVLRFLIALLMDNVAPPMSKEQKGKAAGYLYYSFVRKV